MPEVLEVRGEVYMTNADLVKLNEEQAARGEEPFKNSRNCAAGAIRLLDPKICAERRLAALLPRRRRSRRLAARRRMRVPRKRSAATACRRRRMVAGVQVVRRGGRPLRRGRSSSCTNWTFEIDGLVLKVNDFEQREQARRDVARARAG